MKHLCRTWRRAIGLAALLIILTACASTPPATAPRVDQPSALPPGATLTKPTASASRLDTGALDAFVQLMMGIYDVPGSAIALVQNGQIVFTHAYGVRDTTTKQPVTTRTMFALGSLTKSFTSLGVMLLVQDGKVKLDEPVVTYLPEYRLSDPAATPKVTVRHLLRHTTGLAYDGSTVTNQGMTPDQLFTLVAHIPVIHAPGTTFTYNNVNTDIAGQLIERVSHQPYEEFIRTRIFAPLGMQNADLNFIRLPTKPDYSAFHQIDVTTGMQPIPFYPIGVDMPAAGVIANVEDMARYVAFQLSGQRADGSVLLGRELLAELHTRHVSAAGPWTTPESAMAAARQQGLPALETLLSDPGYAFYWLTNDFEGHPMVWHDGGGADFVTNITLLPEVNAGVVILTNTDRASGFTETVRQHVAEELLNIQPRQDTLAIVEAQMKLLGQDVASRDARLKAARAFVPNPAALERLAGEYQVPSAGTPASVRVIDGRQLQITGEFPGVGHQASLVPYESNAFLINSGDLKGSGRIVFDSDQAGSTTIKLLFGGQPPIPLARRSARPTAER